jgi:hypothetical protein
MSLLISDRRLLLILNPRCASRTLLKIFTPLCSDEELRLYNALKNESSRLDHLTLQESEIAYRHIDLSDYTAIIVIRNPFERILSLYWFLKTLDFDLYEPFVTSLKKNDNVLYGQLNQIKQTDFDSFVALPYFNDPTNLYSFSTFCLHNLRRNSTIQRIKILKVETLASDLKQLGINVENIHEHRLHRPEDVSMSSSSRSIISAIFASDIMEGNYL